jgi:hypothetical protein
MAETRRPVLARRGEPECQDSQENGDPGAGMLLCWLPQGHDGEHFDTYDGWWAVRDG